MCIRDSTHTHTHTHTHTNYLVANTMYKVYFTLVAVYLEIRWPLEVILHSEKQKIEKAFEGQSKFRIEWPLSPNYRPLWTVGGK